jgi:exodeoxyribonuclease VII small subunit
VAQKKADETTPAATPAAPAAADLPDTYEAAREELVETVRRLEAGGTTLEESIALWERGEALADACQRWLDGARARLEARSDPDD